MPARKCQHASDECQHVSDRDAKPFQLSTQQPPSASGSVWPVVNPPPLEALPLQVEESSIKVSCREVAGLRRLFPSGSSPRQWRPTWEWGKIPQGRRRSSPQLHQKRRTVRPVAKAKAQGMEAELAACQPKSVASKLHPPFHLCWHRWWQHAFEPRFSGTIPCVTSVAYIYIYTTFPRHLSGESLNLIFEHVRNMQLTCGLVHRKRKEIPNRNLKINQSCWKIQGLPVRTCLWNMNSKSY